jgi:sialate O-acetylesterase
MAVATDIGDRVDLHPKRKKEVGDRLAANALHAVYKFKDIVPAGPMYISNKINRNSMIIYFNNIGNGLMIKGDTLVGFTIAGVDKKFIPANAIIRGNEVIITSPGVSKPKYVRYAWANAPLEANLYNKDGLPAVPFRTDK